MLLLILEDSLVPSDGEICSKYNPAAWSNLCQHVDGDGVVKFKYGLSTLQLSYALDKYSRKAAYVDLSLDPMHSVRPHH